MEGRNLPHEDGAQLQSQDSNGYNAQNALSSSLQALKSNSAKFATFLRNKTVVAADVVVQSGSKLSQSKAWNNEPVALKQLRTTAAGTFAKAAENTQWLYQTSVKTAVKTAEELRKMSWFGEHIQSQCKTEARNHPIPRLVVACCYTIAAGGLEAEGLFKVEADQDSVTFCAQQLDQGMVLFPPGTSSHTVAALLKSFLANLPEPLLTFRLLPNWLAAMDDVDLIRTLLQQLPAANRNSLALLMATCHRVAQQAAINEMDSQALSEVLAPLLLWKQAPQQQITSQNSTVNGLPPSSIPAAVSDDSATAMEHPQDLSAAKPQTPSTPPAAMVKVGLEGFELQAAERLVETIISNSLSLF